MEITEKWNSRYRGRREPPPVSPLLKEFFHLAPGPKALDLACGMGQNAIFLEEQGFSVDAIDIAEEGLRHLEGREGIRSICADLTSYQLPRESYDLIFCANFLERSLIPQIIGGLRPGGVVIYETFTYRREKFNPDYLLQRNELLHLFLELEIIFYSLNGTRAHLVAQR
ncbi:MAG: class I SAM-dependent methyltransferase [Epsilonproteobacteria bacterium]|nr:tellurium resistance protein TehB [Campylobacterota bacterium]NPA56207.1 class I SAM-dependent methyltransferase [Campylobacterota bacterium]